MAVTRSEISIEAFHGGHHVMLTWLGSGRTRVGVWLDDEDGPIASALVEPADMQRLVEFVTEKSST